MLKIKKLVVKNFRSYGATPTEIEFQEDDLILLVGNNAVGKSSLLSTALHFSIFGENPYGKKEDLINDINKKELYTEIELYDSVKEKTYRICRWLKPDDNKLFINGIEEDTGMYKKDFDNYVISLLKIDKTFFNKFVNNNIVNGMDFLSAPKGEKQKIFNYVFDLDNIEKLREHFKEKQKDFSKKKSDISYNISLFKNNITNKEENLNNYAEQVRRLQLTIKTLKESEQNQQNEINSKLKVVRDNYTKKNKERRNIIKELIKYPEGDSEIEGNKLNKMRDEFNILNHNIKTNNERIESLESIIKTIKEKTNKHSELSSTYRKNMNINNLKIQKKEFNKSIFEYESKKYDDISVISERIKNNEYTVMLKNTEVTSINNKITALNNEIKKLEDMKLTITDNPEQTKKEMDEIDSVCTKKCVYRIMSSIGTLKQIEKQLNDSNNELKNISKPDKMLKEIEDYNKKIEKDKIYLKEVETANKNLAILRQNYEKNINEFKQKWQKYNQFKYSILSDVKSLKEKVKESKECIQKKKEYENEHSIKLEAGKKQKALYELLLKREELQESFDDLKKEMIADVAEYKNIKKNVLSYDKMIIGNEKSLQEWQNNLNTTESELKELNSQYEKGMKDILEYDKKINYLEFLIKNVMDNTQIVKYIVDTNLKVIERMVNAFLRRFEFPHTLKLEFNKDLELIFSNEKPFESFSEGEKLRVKLSFAFAFLFFLKELNKNDLDILILDEIISSSADGNMIDEVFNIFEELRKEMCIVVITHDGRLMERFSKTYRVEKKIFSKLKLIS